MRRYVASAEYKNYNANSRGKRVGDCVKRAISLAFDISYQDAAKLLNETMKSIGAYSWKIRAVYGRVIKELGGSNYIAVENRNYTLEDYVDEFLDKNKIYLVLTGKNKTQSDHIVCIRNGQIWDSWDSRDQFVHGYFEVNRNDAKEFTDINSQLSHLAYDIIEPTIKSEIMRFAEKKNMGSYTFDSTVIRIRNYQVVVDVVFHLPPNDYVAKRREYSFRINLTFEPTATLSEAEEFAKKTAKIRAYDRMYAISSEEKKLMEAAEMRNQYGDLKKEEFYMTPQEERFYKTLPGWIRPLIEYMYIDRPGQYSDSYQLHIRPLPDDPHADSSGWIKFESYDSNSMKDMINRYKKTFEAPFRDYSPTEEY